MLSIVNNLWIKDERLCAYNLNIPVLFNFRIPSFKITDDRPFGDALSSNPAYRWSFPSSNPAYRWSFPSLNPASRWSLPHILNLIMIIMWPIYV